VYDERLMSWLCHVLCNEVDIIQEQMKRTIFLSYASTFVPNRAFAAVNVSMIFNGLITYHFPLGTKERVTFHSLVAVGGDKREHVVVISVR
jgi:hypothetical protein